MAFGSLFCSGLFADQITLKNGDRLTGTILKSDSKILVIKTEAAGEVSVRWAAIASITSTQPLHVGLTGGQMIVGPVASSDGKIQVATPTAGTVTTSKDSIQVIRSDSEQAAYDAEIERLRHPRLKTRASIAPSWQYFQNGIEWDLIIFARIEPGASGIPTFHPQRAKHQ